MERFLLVSLKEKSNQSSNRVYVVSEGSIREFISKHLTSDTIILIDTVDTFISDFQE